MPFLERPVFQKVPPVKFWPNKNGPLDPTDQFYHLSFQCLLRFCQFQNWGQTFWDNRDINHKQDWRSVKFRAWPAQKPMGAFPAPCCLNIWGRTFLLFELPELTWKQSRPQNAKRVKRERPVRH